MTKNIIYLNGEYTHESEAKISFLDRGLQFSEGIYEGISIHLGNPIKLEEHLIRLHNSLKILNIPFPFEDFIDYKDIIKKLMLLNDVHAEANKNGYIYLQVTRGVSARQRVIEIKIFPTLIICIAPSDFPIEYDAIEQKFYGNIQGIKAITVNNERWKRCDLKSLMLLPSVIASQKAALAGAYEAIIVKDNGEICEGIVSNVFIVDTNDIIRTHPADYNILPGIVRNFIKETAVNQKLKFEERAFTLNEALSAKEIFITSTKNTVLPITTLNNQQISDGECGVLTTHFLKLYWENIYEGTWFDKEFSNLQLSLT